MPTHNNTSGKQTRGITGARAVVFVAIMLVAYVAGAAMANSREVSKHLFGASLFLAAAAWGISNLFPAGWFTMKRTVLLAVILFGGLMAIVMLGAKR